MNTVLGLKNELNKKPSKTNLVLDKNAKSVMATNCHASCGDQEATLQTIEDGELPNSAWCLTDNVESKGLKKKLSKKPPKINNVSIKNVKPRACILETETNFNANCLHEETILPTAKDDMLPNSGGSLTDDVESKGSKNIPKPKKKQSKKNIVEEKAKDLPSVNKGMPLSEIEYNIPDCCGFSSARIPVPDDTALPNESSFPPKSVKPKGAGSKSKSVNKLSKKEHLKQNKIFLDKENGSTSHKKSTLSGSDCNVPENSNHPNASVPLPDATDFPNSNLCHTDDVESEDLKNVNNGNCSEEQNADCKEITVVEKESEKEVNCQKNMIPSVTKRIVSTQKPKNEEKPKNRLLTEFFQVRRSNRKITCDKQSEKQKYIEKIILSGSEDGLEVKEYADKGRGVVTNKEIKRGDFVLEYSGDLLSLQEAKKREKMYETQENVGCYMYYFKFNDKQLCVDATKENGRLGRLVNHSKKGNLKTQTFLIDGYPYLIFLANRDISPGEELLYDYGDRSKKSLESHPWLAA